MRKNILFTLLLLTVVVFVGCRKDSTDVTHPTDNSYTIYSENYWSSVFKDYWSATSQSYLFWKYETLDWDAIYDEYLPKFAEIDKMCIEQVDQYFTDSDEMINNVGDKMCYGDVAATKLFQEITYQLHDYHYKLTLYDINVIMRSSASVELPTRDYYHVRDEEGFFKGLDVTIEYDANTTGRITELKRGEYNTDSPTKTLRLVSCLIDGSIPYLHLSSYTIFSESEDPAALEIPLDPNDSTKSDVLSNFEELVRNTPNMKGAIIDVRSNGGGYSDDMEYIIGRFIHKDEMIHFGYSQHKSGPNRYDYTKTTPCYIKGVSEQPTQLFPIAMLADINSVSMAEITCLASRSFSPKSVVVGERTYGATCALAPDKTYSGGIVTTENFQIYSSSFLFYDIEMNFHEGVGVAPDIEVLYDEATWGTTTTDKQREAAIEYIKGL